jgi:cell division protein FtsB
MPNRKDWVLTLGIIMARQRKDEKTKNERKARRRSTGSQIIEIEEAQKRRKAKRAEIAKQEKVQWRLEKQKEKASRPKMSRTKKAVVFGILIIAVLIFISSGYRIIDLNLDKDVYEQRYEEKLAEKARLEKELSLVDDIDYIGQQARDRFHMLRDGEILYVYPEKETVETQ